MNCMQLSPINNNCMSFVNESQKEKSTVWHDIKKLSMQSPPSLSLSLSSSVCVCERDINTR